MFDKDNKIIIIYPHMPFSLKNGGIVVQYYLAQTLNNMNLDVRICNVNDSNKKNDIYNNFIYPDEILQLDIENIIVIYSEGILGNPLDAKHIVRWILSPIGTNVPHHFLYSWGEKDLIYYFNI